MGTLTGGHYTAHVKDGIKNQWHLFDDSRIIATDESALKVRELLYFYFEYGRNDFALDIEWLHAVLRATGGKGWSFHCKLVELREYFMIVGICIINEIDGLSYMF